MESGMNHCLPNKEDHIAFSLYLHILPPLYLRSVKLSGAAAWMFKYVEDNFQGTYSARAWKCAFPHLRS